MKTRLFFSLISLSACLALHGQAPTPRPAPIVSPEIAPERVTFRLRAPQAKQVVLQGQWSKDAVPMTRGDDGVWAATVEPLPAGVWEYSFVADGLNLLDPKNPALKPQREPGKSILHVPSTPPAAWDWQDVPHGTVHQHGYASKALGRPRELWVYTPPGYERDANQRFPMLVLQHGSGDNQRTWVEHGKAHWIFDNLIAQGKVRPMVVVMLDGHSTFGVVPRDDTARRAAASGAFERELFEDAVPLVESVYRVEKAPEHRAIAGLSMGGGQALTVGLGNVDRFSWVGAFSAGLPAGDVVPQFLADPTTANAKLRLLWIAVGRDDFLRQRNEEFEARLKEAGVKHEWHLTEGDHSWPVWRRYLAAFAPLLFQPASVPDGGPVKTSMWQDYERLDFKVDGRDCLLVQPKVAAPGRPWIWRTEFFGHEPQADIALLGHGFHVAYLDVQNMYGAPVALGHMDRFYEQLTRTHGLSSKPVLEGFSRGGLFAFNWAARYPQRVGAIYADAPVCDFRTWPGRTDAASSADWRQLKAAYGFATDEEALAFKGNPVDSLAPLAAARIPLLHVCGDADEVVPMSSNTLAVQARYESLGGEIKVISKAGVGHHPHSLPDPTPIVEWVLAHTGRSSPAD